MIPQLVRRLIDPGAGIPDYGTAAGEVLLADPLDLVLYIEQVWNDANVWELVPGPAGIARTNLIASGAFHGFPPDASPAWDHLIYAYAVENTRIVQIMRRVVREFRMGERLGIPSVATQQWLDTTETIVFGAHNPISAWLSTSTLRPDPEAVRRNAYWRLFGMDLAFGGDDNRPVVYERAQTANTSFVRVFEELLSEIWQAMVNLRNFAGANEADDDRIYSLAEEVGFMLRSRRQQAMLAREELAAATALGWLHLTVETNTPIVVDLRAQATNAGDRLKLIGERVGLPPHSKAAELFGMADDLSVLLRTLEAGFVQGPEYAWILYATVPPPGSPNPGAIPLGSRTRRIITEWSAATGRDLKARRRPVEVQTRRPALTR